MAATMYTPLQFGRHVLTNRFVLSPMTRGRSPTLLANDLNREYYGRFTAGLVCTEGVHISRDGRGWACVPGIWSAEQTEAWKPVVAAVHATGRPFVLQLWHQGRQSHSSYHGGKLPLAPSAVPLKAAYHAEDGSKPAAPEIPREMTEEDILQTIADFVQGAKNAIAAGFDAVEIHAANGYLIDQFLQSTVNQRTDQWGGSIENRARFLLQITRAVGEAIGFDRVGVRLSPNSPYGDMGMPGFAAQYLYAITELGKMNVLFLDVLVGLGFGAHEFVNTEGPVTITDVRKCLPKNVILIASSGFTPETAAEVVASGDADMVSLGRAFLGNPDLPDKVKNGVALAEPPPYPSWFYPHMFINGDPAIGYTKL